MASVIESMSLLVIAGGASTRMGRDKRFIELAGTPMLECLLRSLTAAPWREKILCVEERTQALIALAARYGCRIVTDSVRGRGPIEGIARGLAAITTEYAQVVSADMPFMTSGALAPLHSVLGARTRAKGDRSQVILPLAGGRRQPLAAIYHRSMAECFAAATARGELKLARSIEEVAHRLVALADAAAFFNVNTPADYRLACGRMVNLARSTPLITVSAPQSNTGKTTFIERLLPRLTAAGLRVGVVKGDAHGYTRDTPGKDSARFSAAGAAATAVVAPGGYFIEQRTERRAELASVAAQLADVDLVLIESRAHGVAPQIALYRDLAEPALAADTAALFTSTPQAIAGLYQYDLDDIDAAARLALFLAGR